MPRKTEGDKPINLKWPENAESINHLLFTRHGVKKYELAAFFEAFKSEFIPAAAEHNIEINFSKVRWNLRKMTTKIKDEAALQRCNSYGDAARETYNRFVAWKNTTEGAAAIVASHQETAAIETHDRNKNREVINARRRKEMDDVKTRAESSLVGASKQLSSKGIDYSSTSGEESGAENVPPPREASKSPANSLRNSPPGGDGQPKPKRSPKKNKKSGANTESSSSSAESSSSSASASSSEEGDSADESVGPVMSSKRPPGTLYAGKRLPGYSGKSLTLVKGLKKGGTSSPGGSPAGSAAPSSAEETDSEGGGKAPKGRKLKRNMTSSSEWSEGAAATTATASSAAVAAPKKGKRKVKVAKKPRVGTKSPESPSPPSSAVQSQNPSRSTTPAPVR